MTHSPKLLDLPIKKIRPGKSILGLTMQINPIKSIRVEFCNIA